MNSKKKLFFPITSLLMTLLTSCQVIADNNSDNKNYNCATLIKISTTIPSYALSSDGKVTICHSTSSNSNPFESITVSTNALNGHQHHNDYFSKTGACPTDLVSCPPPLTCTPPLVFNTDKTACVSSSNTCPTLEKFTTTHIPTYAYYDSNDDNDRNHHDESEGDGDDSKHHDDDKVTFCDHTDDDRFVLTTTIRKELQNHDDDYFSKTGACPITSTPCPPIICQSPEVLNAAGTACIPGQTAITPTVNFLSTYDTTPTLTGTVGVTALLNSDTFTVKVGVTTYSKSQMTFSGTNNTIWTLPITTALPVATYDVIATRNSTFDTSVGELTILACSPPKSLDSNGFCNPPSLIPTVTPLTTTITAPEIIVRGTIGEVALVPDTFAVTVNNAAHPTNITGTLTVTGLTWAYTLTKPFYEGTFDVNAIRMVGGVSTPDTTHGELIITDKIDICNANVNQSINRSAWVGSKESSINYYMGKCNITGDSPLPPSFDNRCPLISAPPYVKVTKELCDNGGVKSDASINTVTVRQAQIVNASTENGTISGAISGKLKYGIKAENVGALELNNATVSQNQTTGVTLSGGVTLTGVTLTNASIDFADTTLTCTNSDGTWNVLGGTTKPTTTTTDGTINGTIVSGMITEGKDASGKPIRGNVTTGTYDSNITNLNNVTTKGRRVTGTLINATITNAQTTTINGQTFVLDGTITTGEMLPNTASTFGTVFNATLTNTNVSSTNHCFTSGTVGTRGQLNWKEVVKE